MTENAALVVLSRQMAIKRQMDVIANNIANMNTTSFKAQRVLFEEFLMDTEDGGSVSYVHDFGSKRDVQQGELKRTQNPLDIAIAGNGYFRVETGDGDRYTRNGHLRVDREGYLVTSQGEKLMTQRSKAIQIDPDDPVLTISSDGTVSNSQGPLGRIDLVKFEDEQALLTVGDGLYKTDEAPQPAEDATIVQGMMENSNVEPIMEMTRMIQASRAYQSTQQVLKRDDDIRQQAIDRLGRVQ